MAYRIPPTFNDNPYPVFPFLTYIQNVQHNTPKRAITSEIHNNHQLRCRLAVIPHSAKRCLQNGFCPICSRTSRDPSIPISTDTNIL